MKKRSNILFFFYFKYRNHNSKLLYIIKMNKKGGDIYDLKRYRFN